MEISYRIIAWILSIFVVILSVIIAYNLKSIEQTLTNYVSIFGTGLSVIGLVLTFIQVKSVKEISKATKSEVASTIQKLNLILTISDISKASQIIEIIQGYLRDNKLEIAYFKMRDLKEFLIQMKHFKDISSYINMEDFNESFGNFNINLSNINLSITNGKVINRNTIIGNLEDIATILSTLSNTVKNREMYGN